MSSWKLTFKQIGQTHESSTACSKLAKARARVGMHATRHNAETSNEFPLKQMQLSRKYQKISCTFANS